MISLSHLNFSYDSKEKAIDDLTLTIEPFQKLAILGPNGSGKSTLFKLLSGLVPPDSGTVLFKNQKINHTLKKKLTVLFQEPSLDKELSGIENIYLFAQLQNVEKSKIKKKIQSMAQILEIEKELSKKIKNLSGGQKRKIDIIRALIHEPKIILMDEPTAGLASKNKTSILEANDIASSKTATVIWTTHYLEEIEIADSILLLDKGKKILHETQKETQNWMPGFFRIELQLSHKENQQETIQTHFDNIREHGHNHFSFYAQLPDVNLIQWQQNNHVQMLTIRRPHLMDYYQKITGKEWELKS